MVTLISPTKNGAALIRYLLNEAEGGKGHDGSDERNIYTDTIGLMPSNDSAGYVEQFRQEWSKASSRHKVQCRHLIISPSEKEIAYERSNAPALADMVKGYLREHYPDRRALICIQQDSEGFVDEEGNVKKILHAHVALSDCDIYHYKGVETEKTGFKYLARTFDEYIRDHYQIQIDKGRDMPKRRYLRNKLVTENERDEEGRFYSYQDDIKARINQCISAAHDTESFYAILGDFGLSVVQKEKKTGEQYQTYYLHDLSNISDQSKDSNGKIRSLAKKDQLPAMRSYRQKGYSIEEISQRIKSNGVSHMEREISAVSPDTDPSKESISKEQDLFVAQRNMMIAVGSLLKDTEDMINRLSAQQEKRKLANRRYSQALNTFEMKKNKQKDKSL